MIPLKWHPPPPPFFFLGLFLGVFLLVFFFPRFFSCFFFPPFFPFFFNIFWVFLNVLWLDICQPDFLAAYYLLIQHKLEEEINGTSTVSDQPCALPFVVGTLWFMNNKPIFNWVKCTVGLFFRPAECCYSIDCGEQPLCYNGCHGGIRQPEWLHPYSSLGETEIPSSSREQRCLVWHRKASLLLGDNSWLGSKGPLSPDSVIS